ncbi:MAG TPA: hypothetical protein VMV97_03395 [Sulfuriferula sp.]|nr:hypothetical protein [Sulfuriferula sp.]
MSDLLKVTAQKPDRSLLAYAFLAQATRGEGDLLSGLAPIFKPIARLHAGERFDPNEFSKIVESVYGLKVHPWAVEDIAPRLEKAGLLVRTQHSGEVHEYSYAEITGDFDAVTEEDIRRVIHQFVEFARPILQQNNLPVDERALENGFLAQLVDMNFVSILLKPDRSKEDSRKNSTLTVKKPAEQAEWEQTNAARAKIDVLCAAFIVNAYHSDPNLYAMLMQIATGALVSEVILNLQDPGQTVSLNGLTVILDTPFLMSALNLSSEEEHTFALEICNQLREKGAQLAAFSHSIDELRDNLKAVIGNVRGGYGFGATARRLSGVAFASYAAAVLDNAEARLRQDNVRIIDAPKSQDFFQYFSGDEQERVRASFGIFSNQLAQERDAESIAATIRLRRGKRVKMGRFATAGYLFVTDNPWVAERAQEFLKRQKLFADGEVPPAISERYLAGILWVIFGGKGKDLSRHLLLANCAAALEPRSDVVKQMHRFLSDMDPKQAEFFRTLMTEERAGQYTMQLTLGDSALLNQDNAVAVLEQVKNSLIEKMELDKNAQLDEVKARHEAEVAHQREIAEELRDELLNSQAGQLWIQGELKQSKESVEKLAATVAAEKAIHVEERRKLVERCVRAASKYEATVHMMISVAVATLGGVITWFGIQDSQNLTIKSSGAAFAWLVAFLGFWKIPDYVLGGSMRKLRYKTYRKKMAELGLESDADLYELDWENRTALIRAETEQAIQINITKQS